VLVWLVSIILTSPVIFTKVSVAQCLCSDTNSRRISQSADGGKNWAHLLNSECKGQSLSYRCKITYKTEAPRLHSLASFQFSYVSALKDEGLNQCTGVLISP
jgi:hypothetical protein